MKSIYVFMMAFLMTMPSIAQTEVAGVNLPNTLEVGETQLTLNGAGVREKFWMDMYAGGLYTNVKMTKASKVMNDNSPMAIELHIVSGLISSKKMSSAVEEGFQNSIKGNTKPFRPKINKFISFFSNEITAGDVFDITYLPSKGVVVFKNNKELGTIEGLDFKKALFGIWFCDKPADEDLMNGMLSL
jgi:hypothetical protein